jgi:hypothetical protein
LAAELGVCEPTIRRWRGRSTVADRPHTPKTLQTSLTAIEERLVCELRNRFSASRLTVGHFGAPRDSSRLGRSEVVLSSRATDAPRPRISLTRSIAVETMTLEGMHSKIKQTFVTAVGQRGKWRTLWLGVTTRPGQL